MPPARRRSPVGPLPSVELPRIDVEAAVPSSPVLALLTRPSDDDEPHLLGVSPVDVSGVLRREKAKGEPGEVVVVPVPGDDVVERVLLAGSGDASPSALRRAGAALARRASSATSLALDVRAVRPDAAALQALVEGLLLASYSYSLASKPKPRALESVTIVVPEPSEAGEAVQRASSVANATAAARDLVNTPSREKTPEWLALAAQSLLDGLEVDVLDETQLAERGFGGVLAVGQGSTRPPRFIEVRYDGTARAKRRTSPHVVLVGKGITFDSGGLSLKPNDSMVAMKTDMGGAAAVLGTLRAVASLGLPLRVTGLVAAAENMPSGTAQRPGDVIRHYGGRTVEVLNTDAEGRLVLADALVYADRDLQADVVVDVATLTGAMPIALGRRCAGLFASDDDVATQLLAAAEASGEQAWRMPLVEDYRPALDSPVADLRNIGQPKLKLQGGSITAALFLREFTGGRRWAHLDIAGPARANSDEDEVTKGGTGYGVRLLTYWLASLAA